MAKFCPKCGNQMSDNAKFCMGCGAKLDDYSSGGVNIKEGFVQRSQVGAASVGNVNISPKISAAIHTGEKDICPKCGFGMQRKGSIEENITFNGTRTTITAIQEGWLCPKCNYK